MGERAIIGAVSEHPLYQTWHGIRRRCRDASDPRFGRYGGRGIDVCDRWYLSFEAFASDVGEKPSAAHSLDRIDNNGGYEPENCRWATPTQQAMNRKPKPGSIPVLVNVTCSAQAMLRSAVETMGESQRALASQLGCSQTCVNAWMAGRSRPEHHYRLAIQRLFGIPADDWMTEVEYAIAYGPR